MYQRAAIAEAVSKLGWVDCLLVVLVVVGVLIPELGLRRIPDMRGSGAAAIRGPRSVQPGLQRIRALPARHVRDERRAGIVAGIVLGRTEAIPDADWQLFRRSGLWHLLAASGQNVALVAVLCVVAAIACGAGRLVGTVWGLAAVPAYLLVVGGGPSITRAAIMAELALLAWLAGRLADLRHAILVSAVLMEWIWPGVHRSLGFQLSYACVLGLVAWASPATDWLAARGVPKLLAGGFAATAACTAATAPVLVATTGSAPMTAGIANLVAVPLASGILIIGLPSCLAGLVHDGWAGPGLHLCGWLAAGVLATARATDALPFARTTSFPIACALPVLAAWWRWGHGVPHLFWRMCQKRAEPPGLGRLRVVVPVTIVLCALLAAGTVPGLALVPGIAAVPGVAGPPPPPVAAGHVRIAVLDVGQGMATLVAVPGHAVLVDVGPASVDVAAQVRRLGVRRIDGVVLSHDADDHRGGLPAVAAQLHPAWVARPRNGPGDWRGLREVGVPVVDVCDGDRLDVGDARLLVRNPPCDHLRPTTTGDPANDNAAVVVVEHGDTRSLIPGDCEATITSGLDLGPLELIDVAHHGSEDPGLPALLDASSPGLATISVGDHNRFGHPRADVIEAIRAAHVPLLRTDRDGSVVLDGDGHELRRLA